jgi:hypothetical protein
MASRFAQFAASLSKSASNLSKSAASLSNKMQGKNLAGKDAHGNLYYNDPSQQTARSEPLPLLSQLASHP